MPTENELLAKAQQLHSSGQRDEAWALYQQIVEANPQSADALHLMGVFLAEGGQPDQATEMYRRALAIHGNRPQFHNNLGVACQQLSQLDQAKQAFQKAIELDPEFVDPLYNLANLLKQVEQPEAAFFTYLRVLELDPSRVDAMINLGNLMFDKGEHQDAIESFKGAIAASDGGKPAARAYVNLGNTYRRIGEVANALGAYDEALKIWPHDGLAIKRALTLPVVTQSWDDIHAVRRDYEARIDELLARDISVDDPALETSTTTFFLAYHGLGDRAFQEKVAKLQLKACPALDFVADHCRDPKPPSGKIKLGLVSAYFRLHSVGRLMRGFVEQFDRDVFEVTVFTLPGQRDEIVKAINDAADKVVVLPTGLGESRDCIAAAAQDILFYADLGMDIRTYFLAYARLAPVQCVTWGHPDTTGLPNIDHYISSDLIEPDGADDEYSERLFRLPTLPTSYLPPTVPAAPKDRDALGLDSNKRFYLCPQSTIKHHPDLDVMIGELLRRDTEGEMLLLEGSVREWTEQVSARMARTISDVVDRVRVLPRVSPNDFLSLLGAADVVIDAPHWSGGNTSYEAFAMGTPIVTHAGDFMRGRVTLGQYRMMDIDDAITGTPEACGQLAAEIGTDPMRRNDLAARITERREALFDDLVSVRALEEFFKSTRVDV